MAPRVFIVDDHPSFRAFARALLEAEGFIVVGEAENGEDAISGIAHTQPDVVLLDVQLPDMTGFDVCAVACRPGGPKVVLVSSRDAVDYNGLLETCGAVGFIPKGELSGDALTSLLA